MEDFTGGVTETINLQKDAPRDLFTVMCKGHDRKSLMGSSIDVSLNLHLGTLGLKPRTEKRYLFKHLLNL